MVQLPGLSRRSTDLINKRINNRTGIGASINQDNVNITDDNEKDCSLNDYFTIALIDLIMELFHYALKTTNILGSIE